jgi:hypothetical protein
MTKFLAYVCFLGCVSPLEAEQMPTSEEMPNPSSNPSLQELQKKLGGDSIVTRIGKADLIEAFRVKVDEQDKGNKGWFR